jgi:hypothetical protein
LRGVLAHSGDAMTPPFIAMELVNGPPLTQYADSHQLSLRDRVELVARACDAVRMRISAASFIAI